MKCHMLVWICTAEQVYRKQCSMLDSFNTTNQPIGKQRFLSHTQNPNNCSPLLKECPFILLLIWYFVLHKGAKAKWYGPIRIHSIRRISLSNWLFENINISLVIISRYHMKQPREDLISHFPFRNLMFEIDSPRRLWIVRSKGTENGESFFWVDALRWPIWINRQIIIIIIIWINVRRLVTVDESSLVPVSNQNQNKKKKKKTTKHIYFYILYVKNDILIKRWNDLAP